MDRRRSAPALQARRRPMTSSPSPSAWRTRLAIRRSRSCISSAPIPATSRSRSAIRTSIPRSALGFDASVRWRHRRFGGELTYFRNSIDDFIFRNPMSDEEFVERYPDEAEAVGEFPFVEFVARDSVLQGVEAHADVELGRRPLRRTRIRPGARRAARHERPAAADATGALHRRPEVSAQRVSGRRQRRRRPRSRIACSARRPRPTATTC